jgi:hypothetical protein
MESMPVFPFEESCPNTLTTDKDDNGEKGDPAYQAVFGTTKIERKDEPKKVFGDRKILEAAGHAEKELLTQKRQSRVQGTTLSASI